MKSLGHYLKKAIRVLSVVYTVGISGMLIALGIWEALPHNGLWFFYTVGIMLTAVLLNNHAIYMVVDWVTEDEF